MIISLLKVVTAEDKTMRLNAEMELEEFRTKAGRFPIIEKEPVEFVIRHVKNRQAVSYTHLVDMHTGRNWYEAK